MPGSFSLRAQRKRPPTKSPNNSPKRRCRRLFTAREGERAADFVARDAFQTLAMESCNHTTLELLPGRKKTLRCRQCHLTIDANELGDGFCPECFDRSGKKFYEFEETESKDGGAATYRCEECGAIIKASA